MRKMKKPIAPGMKYKHYSPETPLTIVKDLNKKLLMMINGQSSICIPRESKKFDSRK